MIPITLNEVITADNNALYVIMSREDDDILKMVNVEFYEGANLGFYFSNFNEMAHIKGIHDVFYRFLTSSNYTVDRVVIEEVQNKIGFGKVCMTKNDRSINFLSSISDIFIFHVLSNAPIFIYDSTWDDLEEYDPDEYTYHEYID
jgi:bifunctional DNase/RNase